SPTMHMVHIWEDGEFTPVSPEANYPALYCQNGSEYIAALYNPLFLTVPEGKKKLTVINATAETSLALNIKGKYQTVIYDCMGNIVHQGVFTGSGPVELKIPRSGVWTAAAVE
ncbi:MAG TPA: hypothetical protein PLZ84_08305, partial [Clostridia bacterium]|nr:hypothetical protein [Clostridia bacterium]